MLIYCPHSHKESLQEEVIILDILDTSRYFNIPKTKQAKTEQPKELEEKKQPETKNIDYKQDVFHSSTNNNIKELIEELKPTKDKNIDSVEQERQTNIAQKSQEIKSPQKHILSTAKKVKTKRIKQDQKEQKSMEHKHKKSNSVEQKVDNKNKKKEFKDEWSNNVLKSLKS